MFPCPNCLFEELIVALIVTLIGLYLYYLRTGTIPSWLTYIQDRWNNGPIRFPSNAMRTQTPGQITSSRKSKSSHHSSRTSCGCPEKPCLSPTKRSSSSTSKSPKGSRSILSGTGTKISRHTGGSDASCQTGPPQQKNVKKSKTECVSTELSIEVKASSLQGSKTLPTIGDVISEEINCEVCPDPTCQTTPEVPVDTILTPPQGPVVPCGPIEGNALQCGPCPDASCLQNSESAVTRISTAATIMPNEETNIPREHLPWPKPVASLETVTSIATRISGLQLSDSVPLVPSGDSGRETKSSNTTVVPSGGDSDTAECDSCTDPSCQYPTTTVVPTVNDNDTVKQIGDGGKTDEFITDSTCICIDTPCPSTSPPPPKPPEPSCICCPYHGKTQPIDPSLAGAAASSCYCSTIPCVKEQPDRAPDEVVIEATPPSPVAEDDEASTEESVPPEVPTEEPEPAPVTEETVPPEVPTEESEPAPATEDNVVVIAAAPEDVVVEPEAAPAEPNITETESQHSKPGPEETTATPEEEEAGS